MRKLLIIIFCAPVYLAQAQPAGYYLNTLGKNGSQPKLELKNIIDKHSTQKLMDK